MASTHARSVGASIALVPTTDLPIEELRTYRPDVPEPVDFDRFWAETINESRALGGPVEFAIAKTPFTELEVLDLTFPGFAGEPIRAWIAKPQGNEPRPAVLEYVGYNGGRGLAGERLHWAAAGYVHIVMDTRGQGSEWGSGGDTPDPHGSGPAAAGFLTRGIGHRTSYYYRRVFTDAVRMVDAARSLPFVDPNRVAVTGISQGGGISLAVAGLSDGLVAVMPDVPFLCNFRRSVDIAPGRPFAEISTYLGVHRDQERQVFDTLAYFDGVNFARRASAPSLFSVALMDEIVPPSGVFAAHNRYAGADSELIVYPFNNHEGGQFQHWHAQAAWLGARLAH
jgi:cephalosporin-C deacetylase